ncbi:ectomycorrhiza-upregulated zf-MYND domain-containing protein [Ilyonectria robusta]|uniref:ectomycorrhiza-upregulated zf-MYND domain-containing protein n=1 Tax=Ilyonectria robusta TaxID=1079257 RepID=UPI001E8EC82A|nr:ectomycorrhiza-upregulated zf-MYND domain-containing protein [Ilyonectria robusta]KAH8654892.1 ectomycorrhiza-upregulated zf-MYND domain-containing protein [Ilyonectria robusta]
MALRGPSKPSSSGAMSRKSDTFLGPPPQYPADHPIFSHNVPPVPGLIEVPLVLHRVGTQSTNRADLDNQIATHLNINPDSGFAPPAWQSHVGTIVVARKDKNLLLLQYLEGVWMYCDHILDLFGEGEGAPRWLYNRQAFEEWWVGYCEEQKEFRPGMGGEKDPDDWWALVTDEILVSYRTEKLDASKRRAPGHRQNGH